MRLVKIVQCDQIWQNFKSLWLFFDGLFCNGQNFDPNWANFYDIGEFFIVVNAPILKILFSHLVTLQGPERVKESQIK